MTPSIYDDHTAVRSRLDGGMSARYLERLGVLDREVIAVCGLGIRPLRDPADPERVAANG